MTDLRTAAQQALEILERLHGGCTDSDDGTVEAITVWCPGVIEALRAALAEPEPPKTAWAHLPNAVHIDRILAHAKEHPRKWAVVWDAALDAAWYAALDAAWDAVRDAAWGAVLDAAGAAALDAAWGAISALIAWDDAGLLLSLPIEAVRAMADKGNHAAILIYPAMLAMKEDK